MAKSKLRWTVRVALERMELDTWVPCLPRGIDKSSLDFLLESLRYAGAVNPVTWTSPGGTEFVGFDIRCPQGIGNAEEWAKSNAERMATFGWTTKVAANPSL